MFYVLFFLLTRIRSLREATYNFKDIKLVIKDEVVFKSADIYYKKALQATWFLGYKNSFNFLYYYGENNNRNEILMTVKRANKQANIKEPLLPYHIDEKQNN